MPACWRDLVIYRRRTMTSEPSEEDLLRKLGASGLFTELLIQFDADGFASEIFATRNIVPDPQNGSKTVSPGHVEGRIARIGRSTGYGAG